MVDFLIKTVPKMGEVHKNGSVEEYYSGFAVSENSSSYYNCRIDLLAVMYIKNV